MHRERPLAESSLDFLNLLGGAASAKNGFIRLMDKFGLLFRPSVRFMTTSG